MHLHARAAPADTIFAGSYRVADGHETAAGPREATQTVQIIAAARFLPMLPVQAVHDGVALAADGHEPFTTPGDTIEIGKRNAVANLGCGIPADPVAAVQDRPPQPTATNPAPLPATPVSAVSMFIVAGCQRSPSLRYRIA